jgi:hypothetical protein
VGQVPEALGRIVYDGKNGPAPFRTRQCDFNCPGPLVPGVLDQLIDEEFLASPRQNLLQAPQIHIDPGIVFHGEFVSRRSAEL